MTILTKAAIINIYIYIYIYRSVDLGFVLLAEFGPWRKLIEEPWCRENGPKKRNYPVSGSCVDENALLMSEVRGECRLVRDDRKATVTQITTRYDQDMQNTISEHTTRRTLKQMGYSSRRPHRVQLLSAKNRKQRLQFIQAHQ